MTSDCADFRTACEELLQRAGGGIISLAEVAKALGVSQQEAHSRIHAGKILGMMLDDQLVVPALQLWPAEESGTGRRRILPGIERVVTLFDETGAGRWSALQFLVERDPNVRCPPIEALRAGRADLVEWAARGYLGVDEG